MEIQLEKVASEIEDERSETALYKIISYPADFTLQGLYDKWKESNIQIPPFQRQYVWKLAQASRLVESFLLGLPVPGIFFYKEKETGNLVVIDGQQRLKSVFSFFEGEFPESKEPFRLREVQEKWKGKMFSELAKHERQRLKDSVLRATIVDQLDPKDNSSIFHIFERLNTGGTSLRPQEVRNCIHSGPFNDLLMELNREKSWRRIIGTERPDKRMRDIELILRFLALVRAGDAYYKPMKNFLNDFMKVNRYAKPAGLSAFHGLFEKTVKTVVSCLGKKPFHIRVGLNAAAYDCVMTGFALTKKEVPSDIKTRYRRLLNNETFQALVSSGTTDIEAVKRRISLARKTLFGD